MGTFSQASGTNAKFFVSTNGILCTSKGQIVVPKCLYDTIITEYHVHVGHYGISRCVKRM